jgi:hypothetical protein
MVLSMVVGRGQARVMLPALRVPSGGLVWSDFSSYSRFKSLESFICHESEACSAPPSKPDIRNMAFSPFYSLISLSLASMWSF